ncbi:hypothetical protein FS837_011587 [Tulasnella sp. UAMH 9824]|nr:hypothetical protein FS837_011587 [Tulasnella sp. UAMH 9824]
MAKITPITPATPIGLPERGPILSEVVGDGTLELVDSGVIYRRLDVMLRVIGVEEVIVLLLVRECAIFVEVEVLADASNSSEVFGTSATITETSDRMTDPLSPTCRILVVASELSLALNLVDKIVSTSSSQPNNKYDAFDDPDNEGSIVEWTISNKYYDANVHFLAKTPSLPPAKPLWPPETDQDKVPAIIFVFSDGELFKERFLSLKQGLDEHEAEITIAARLPSQDGEGEEEITAEEITDFFSDHAFEFVDVPVDTADVPVPADPHDIYGIPRIVNALSTVMWPSLVRKPRAAPTTMRDYLVPPQTVESITKIRDSSVFPDDFDPEKPGEDTEAPESLFLGVDGHLAEKDLEALEAWLDGDLDAPWKGESTVHSLPPPPMIRQSSSGFEDDFDEFVSAAPPALSPSPSAAELDREEAMPSQEEIRLTAQRIFGRKAADSGADGIPSTADDFQFDLTEVLGVLQAMKEEVAEIPDMEARRQAAARIALGFASGLGLSSND